LKCSSFFSLKAYNKRGTGARGGAQKSKKFELTEEQKQEIREAFDLFDTDGSGEWRTEGSENHRFWLP